MMCNFILNVSLNGYPTKPTEVGGISFIPQLMTVQDLETLVRKGRVFCYDFHSSGPCITQRDRRIDKFKNTSVIFFDIDKVKTPMQEYVELLPFKPNLSYTSYSNGKNDRYSYRLVYVFNDSFKTVAEFEKARNMIASVNGMESHYDDELGCNVGFDKRPVNQQYYRKFT